MAVVVAVGRVGMAVHFPSDVLAGAALGTATSLAMWSPRIGELLQRIADRAGALRDGVLHRAAARLGDARR
jgi:membrane-associated phospholipid phosphatase